jgi:hypothetical protein
MVQHLVPAVVVAPEEQDYLALLVRPAVSAFKVISTKLA